MSNLNAVLNQRLKGPSNGSKMAEMARQSASGNLTTFSGMFGVAELTQREKERLSEILDHYSLEEKEIKDDLQQLIALTSEVKAINNQAALLHGERIKRVHTLLVGYREGAFTAWMMTAYGNRQTPYNLMQYYDFCEAMPKNLRGRIEEMPRQVIYVLASREGSLETKQEIVEKYKGEPKQELLSLIRKTFPLAEEDKRKEKVKTSDFLNRLSQLHAQLEQNEKLLKGGEKREILALLQKMQKIVQK